MNRPPRPPHEPILSGYLIWRIVFVSVIIATFCKLLFNHHLMEGASIEAARTVTVNTLVAGELFYLFNSRFIMQPSLSLTGLLGNRQALVAVGTLVVFQLAFTYLEISNTLFGTAPIPADEWAWILGSGLAVFLLVEIEKAIVRSVKGRKSGRYAPPAVSPRRRG
jgi:magnesium-transporting ATPase (P-type)